MIEVSNFTKKYGDFVAVDNLSFAIGKGEIFGFIGPNGAGKSTTIRFLATLLRPTAGEGRVAGFSVTAEPMAVRRVIGFMPDDFGVYDGMKVWEFLDFFAVAYEIPRSYRKKIIGEVLELLELTHKRDDYVNGLSKGMKQRLCLAKTLVHDPPVLILDEPASGLDPGAARDEGALERAQADGQDDSDIEPHPFRACRLLHLDRHHRARQAAGRRQHPADPAADPITPGLEGPGAGRDHGTGHPAVAERFGDPIDRNVRSYGHRRIRRSGSGHGPPSRPAGPRGDRGAVVCGGAAVARGSLHDDHQRDRQLEAVPHAASR